MSPDIRLARLGEEVRAELARIERVGADLAEASRALVPGCPDPARMAVAGYLHSFYTGCEAVLARIARAGGVMPAGESWHQALLVVAAAPVEGLRPPVATARTAALLSEFLRFRHFFRASYGVELDVERLRRLVDLVPEAHEFFRRDVLAFLAAL